MGGCVPLQFKYWLIVSIKRCESERGVRGKMDVTRYIKFISTARPQMKFDSRRQLPTMLRDRVFRPGNTVPVREIANVRAYFVSLFQTTGCLYAGKAIRR